LSRISSKSFNRDWSADLPESVYATWIEGCVGYIFGSA